VCGGCNLAFWRSNLRFAFFGLPFSALSKQDDGSVKSNYRDGLPGKAIAQTRRLQVSEDKIPTDSTH
jgi:hypothetical protein